MARINRINSEIFAAKIFSVMAVITTIVCLAQIVFSIYVIDGSSAYIPSSFEFGVVNICAVSLPIVCGAFYVKFLDNPGTPYDLIGIAIAIAIASTFIFVNVYGMYGYLSTRTLAFISLCTPLLPLFAIIGGTGLAVPWIARDEIKDRTRNVAQMTPQANREQEMLQLWTASSANPNGQDAIRYAQLIDQFNADYPNQIAVIKCAEMKRLWIASQKNAEGPEFALFNRLNAQFVQDFPGVLEQIMQECNGSRS